MTNIEDEAGLNNNRKDEEVCKYKRGHEQFVAAETYQFKKEGAEKKQR